MEVLVLAAHDAALLDDLRGIIDRAMQASETHIKVVASLNDPPGQPLMENQLLLWRDNRSCASLAALIQDTEEHLSRPNTSRPSSVGSNITTTTTTIAGSNPPETDPATAAALMVKRIHKRDRKIKSLTAEVSDWKAQLDEALARAKFIETEQEQFFEDVQHMKQAYDKLHNSHQKLLWEYLPSKDPEMKAIPRLTQPENECETSIGRYPLFEVLGYGQYAVVYASRDPENPSELLAVKAIDKEKLLDLVTLHRVNSEISSLLDPEIQHPGILGIREVIHTKRHIYLITERGGKDLFEFFGPHDDGVAEETIKPLMLRVALALQRLHRHNYCHRDLKPENILYWPDHTSPDQTVKLVDFGLCTRATCGDDQMLHDFCGSPGFFAPEILLCDLYDGFKADLWSLGCILLELIVGNEMFTTSWMVMYELETLKDRKCFQELVQQSLAATRAYCYSSQWKYSVKLRSLLLLMLCENPLERPSVHQMLEHPWFDDVIQRGLSSSTTSSSSMDPDKPVAAAVVLGVSGKSLSSPRSPKTTLPAAVHDHHANLMGSRPVSAERGTRKDTAAAASFGSPHISALVPPSHDGGSSNAATPPSLPSPRACSPSKACLLPSISPEKPVGSRSPEKSFTKRSHPANGTGTGSISIPPSASWAATPPSNDHHRDHHSSSSNTGSSSSIQSSSTRQADDPLS